MTNSEPLYGGSDAAVKTCSQCGRVGTRGFVTTEETTATFSGGVVTVPPITFCANTTACRKRWPKEAPDA